MHIIARPTIKENLHPITILTVCKVLIDQFCTDNGLASWELVQALSLPTFIGTQMMFHTATGKFVTN